jgi:hypothetical protein
MQKYLYSHVTLKFGKTGFRGAANRKLLSMCRQNMPILGIVARGWPSATGLRTAARAPLPV